MTHEIAPRTAWEQWPRLWTPKVTKSVRSQSARGTRARPALAEHIDERTTARLHRLVAAQASRLSAQPRDLYSCGDPAAKAQAEEFAESCLLSVALWRRFGTAEFAETLGWLERTDYAAVNALLLGRAVDAAVQVWSEGHHAVANTSSAQRCAHATELRAWELGHGRRRAEDARESAVVLRTAEQGCLLRKGGAAGETELARLRAACASPAGEALVRDAYQRLLNATHHPLWDLWRKRQFLITAIFENGELENVRKALLQVRGYGGLSADGDFEGWGLAFDLATATPLSEDRGPTAWSGDYVTWLRRREATKKAPLAAISATRSPPSCGRRRPALPVAVDLTGM